jgi:hypothetical protein
VPAAPVADGVGVAVQRPHVKSATPSAAMLRPQVVWRSNQAHVHIDLDISAYESALVAQDNVVAVIRKRQEPDGSHWSPDELEVHLRGARRPFSTGVTKFGLVEGAPGILVHHRMLPCGQARDFYAAVRRTMTAAINDAVAVSQEAILGGLGAGAARALPAPLGPELRAAGARSGVHVVL